MAVMDMDETNKLTAVPNDVSLHVTSPNIQNLLTVKKAVIGTVNVHKVKSDKAKLTMKKLRNMRIWGLRTMAAITKVLPAAPKQATMV
uniref:Uncharacterized protein n=1 Tax=Romanomermis culicivorax TaxID=13658 RepID=A0A915IMX1_ROMCU